MAIATNIFKALYMYQEHSVLSTKVAWVNLGRKDTCCCHMSHTSCVLGNILRIWRIEWMFTSGATYHCLIAGHVPGSDVL